MASNNERVHAEDKGFWDGGPDGHGSNRESGGRKSGSPGVRKPQQTGVRTDLDTPPPAKESGGR